MGSQVLAAVAAAPPSSTGGCIVARTDNNPGGSGSNTSSPGEGRSVVAECMSAAALAPPQEGALRNRDSGRAV